jgi:pyridoxine 4-dehydrogenase
VVIAGSELLTGNREHDAKPSQVALAWLLGHSPVMLPIPGTSSVEHLEENVEATRLQLSEEELERIEAAA